MAQYLLLAGLKPLMLLTQEDAQGHIPTVSIANQPGSECAMGISQVGKRIQNVINKNQACPFTEHL